MTLFVVSTPIGNPDDITLRAINVLKSVDFVICEEFKIGSKLLKKLGIKKDLVCLNEHNEDENAEDILQQLLTNKKAALVSDAGTPLFADPGTYLVKRCHASGVKVVPVPGASSIMAALSVAGVNTKRFYYAGFLTRKSETRQKELASLLQYRCPAVIMDTPYRLLALLEDIKLAVGPRCDITLLLSLTKPDEQIVKGSINQVLKEVRSYSTKKEFVLILSPKSPIKYSRRSKRRR